MDLPQIKELVDFLAPALPILTMAGEAAVQESAKNLAAETHEAAKGLWDRIRSAVAARPAAQEAVTDLAADPENEDAKAVFRVQLRKLLEENPALAAEVAGLMKRDTVQRVLAERNSAVSDVTQLAASLSRSHQEVAARDGSRIQGVKQRVDVQE